MPLNGTMLFFPSLPLSSPTSLCLSGSDTATEESQVAQYKETVLNESLEKLRTGINEAKVGVAFLIPRFFFPRHPVAIELPYITQFSSCQNENESMQQYVLWPL